MAPNRPNVGPSPPAARRGAATWAVLVAVWIVGGVSWTIWLAVLAYLVVAAGR